MTPYSTIFFSLATNNLHVQAQQTSAATTDEHLKLKVKMVFLILKIELSNSDVPLVHDYCFLRVSVTLHLLN